LDDESKQLLRDILAELRLIRVHTLPAIRACDETPSRVGVALYDGERSLQQGREVCDRLSEPLRPVSRATLEALDRKAQVRPEPTPRPTEFGY
jgi:hypothetical protein